jgi:hypothetical protein
MPTGGESSKLANAYEGVWTIYNVLDLLRGDADEVTVEPIQEGQGIEFIKVRRDGIREFHSVKIQTTKNVWTVALLATKDKKTGRSILGDLIGKVRGDPKTQSRFISEVTANPLKLICNDAAASPDPAAFRLRLSAARAVDFRDYILPVCGGSESDALDCLKRLDIVSVTAPLLVDNVEREISRSLYRLDGTAVDPPTVRRLVGEFILQNLGRTVTRVELLAALELQGFHEAIWSQSTKVLGRVEAQNNAYHRSVRGQLINGANIHRQEAEDAFKIVVGGTVRIGAFVGVAGLGKSCTAAELLDYLRDSNMPYLALRLDDPFDALTPRQLGLSLDLPMSPVDLLAAIAEGGPCVLLLDQLDALSIISGRNRKLWRLVDALLEETKAYPRMRVWLACRSFDLEHDPRLRALFAKEKAHPIMLRPLTGDEVLREVRKAGVKAEILGAMHIEVLRTPMHLSLFLEGDPANKPPFKTVQDLYRNYWDQKQTLVRERLGRDPRWREVIDLLCDKLSAEQILSVPTDFLDDSFREDAQAMASENVLACEKGLYRFFHETFFDYAFARRFVRRGKRLIDLLLLGGEQHLFRRSQVRQILTYLRGDNPSRYLEELTAVLQTAGVRTHIIKLVLDWLRTIDDPTPEELALLNLP